MNNLRQRTTTARHNSDGRQYYSGRWRMGLLLLCLGLMMSETTSEGVRDPDGSKVTSVPRHVEMCFGFADYYANVFGVMVVGAGVERESVQHAADVLAGYLDNDHDGWCDDPKVCKKLRVSLGTILMFKSEKAAEDFWETPMFFPGIKNDWYGNNIVLNGISYKELYEDEMQIDSCAYGGTFRSYMTKCEDEFDATLKETLDLITAVGVAPAYGATFGKRKGSTVGGYIQELNGDCGWGYDNSWIDPSSGDCTGYFAYDSKSCDFPCLVTKGLYWSITSMLGAQDYKQQIAAIKDEWLLYSEALIEADAPDLYDLLRDTETYPWLPTVLPNGTYFGKPNTNEPSLMNFSAYFVGLIAFVIVVTAGSIFLIRWLRRRNVEGFEDFEEDDESKVRKHEMNPMPGELTDEQKRIQVQQHEAQRRQFHREVFM